MDQRERFPIMNDPEITWVPWRMMAPHEAQAYRNHSQSLSELARRCGLSICEALAVVEDRPWRQMPAEEARAALKSWVEVHYATCE